MCMPYINCNSNCNNTTPTTTTKYHLCCELGDVIPANANSKLK